MAELIVHNPPRATLKASGYIGSPEGDIALTENDNAWIVGKVTEITNVAEIVSRIKKNPVSLDDLF